MLSQTGEIIVLGLVFAASISAVVLAVLLLQRGQLYRRLSPEARPRRWVLVSVLILFAVFVVWFPVWITWPHALISRLLTLLFGTTFFVVGLSFKWLSGLVDRFIERKGWPLR